MGAKDLYEVRERRGDGLFGVRFCREFSEFREFKEVWAVVALSLACEWVSMRYYVTMGFDKLL